MHRRVSREYRIVHPSRQIITTVDVVTDGPLSMGCGIIAKEEDEVHTRTCGRAICSR